jgi:cob(I)alamin adenosyltransferase
VEQFGLGRFAGGKPSPADIEAARSGMARVREVMASAEYQLIVLEEANVAVTYGLMAVQELLGIIDEKPAEMEMVITGRNASPRIIAAADLVTEMKAVKHYFKKGVRARVGIEK